MINPLINLSVNVNKVATLRNSRGGGEPDLLAAVAVILAAGAPGITVHPRADERHIRRSDVTLLAEFLTPERERVELNIEGDPRDDLIELACEVRPHQFTLVPVRAGELTSEAGWDPREKTAHLAQSLARLKAHGIRTSLFVDPNPEVMRWAKDLGADRVELYTEPFAAAFKQGPDAAQASFTRFAAAAEQAHALGLEINAGHDLDLENLTLFRRLPHLAEVSIGHALISRALFVGLDRVVREYLACLRGEPVA